MAENKTLLVLRLEGALQSWGENSKWDFRGTADMPTKSGIVGLIGCAMGLERGNPLLAELCESLSIAVRADRKGARLTDFQTVTGNPLKSADGTPKAGGNTIIASRAYLQDACFTVFLQTDRDWQGRIAAAFQSPQWCLYLGRKSCVPSCPVVPVVTDDYADLMDAVCRYPAAARADETMLYESEISESGAAGILRPDQLQGANRSFRLRRVWRGTTGGPDHVSDQS